jgi:lipoate-protein ligase B
VEEALIRALAPFGIVAGRTPGLTGVWTQGRKLASIGVHARDWVTWHGFALNVTTDLSYFDLMVPCGIADVQMTSVEKELEPTLATAATVDAQVRAQVAAAFAAVFDLELMRLDADAFTRDLRYATDGAPST